jgi:capsid assembly protease
MYERIIQKALTTPWALHPSKLMVVQQVLLERHSGVRPSADEIRARLGYDPDERETPKPTTNGHIAVIPVHGMIVNRAFDAVSGATSAEATSSVLTRLRANDEISLIVMDFCTPGGTVDGVPELAAEIFATREVKPIHAHVNGLCASAGWWLASQCTSISSMPSAETGSQGVYCLHVDYSEHLAKEGIKVIPFVAGDYKLDGAPWFEMSDETKAHIMEQVNAIYAQFVGDAARGRGVSVADAKANFGQGWCFVAKEAKRRGMIDRVETFEQLITRLSGTARKRGAARAQALAFHPIEAADVDVPSVSAEADAPEAEAEIISATAPETVAEDVAQPADAQFVADRDRARAKVAIAKARLAS